ncbi:TPA: hypothetical protein N0F65_004544 [Lagenidium giganteum]|uniref:Uncharacterized protein n=1 Tax=Lagenidium giganteum TaxID=4803 RepID=A0AAV2ZFA7_9STRA|nr:TPA: hypothetical protein N0F65_004544 [Lagenidium giganteum]
MRSFRVLYDEWLTKSPLLTKSLTSAALFGLGDCIAQRLEEDDDSSAADSSEGNEGSMERTVRMMVWGGLLFAPVAHGWYNGLERVVRGTGKLAVVQKIALDQLVFTPPVTLAFFTSTKLMEQRRLDALPLAWEEATNKLVPTLQVNYVVWPLIHVCTFGFVPLRYRILFINCMSLGWSAFLSGMSNKRTETLAATS